MDKRLVRLSKFLSRVLRHHPEAIDLTLDAQGWAEVAHLLAQARSHGVALTRETLQEIVAQNDKQRFALSDDGTRIRASQGHSIPVDLGLAPTEPPELLYHGTAARSIPSIRARGLLPGRRNHVHLSADETTAARVGGRHGNPMVITVRAGLMHAEGYPFYLSANGVWLTEHVPVAYLDIPDAYLSRERYERAKLQRDREPAAAMLEQDARDLFPFESMSPEEYAARHGADWLCCSFPGYRFQDEKLDAWIQRLGEIFFTPGLLRHYQEELLTPDELERVRRIKDEHQVDPPALAAKPGSADGRTQQGAVGKDSDVRPRQLS